MNPLDTIQGPVSPVYTFIESRRTKLIGAMTVSELRAACAVLEFDRWLFDDDYRNKFIFRNAWLNLVQQDDGAYWVYDLVIYDGGKEALIRITENDGALKTARGDRKLYKTIETAIADVKRILVEGAGENEFCSVSIDIDLGRGGEVEIHDSTAI